MKNATIFDLKAYISNNILHKSYKFQYKQTVYRLFIGLKTVLIYKKNPWIIKIDGKIIAISSRKLLYVGIFLACILRRLFYYIITSDIKKSVFSVQAEYPLSKAWSSRNWMATCNTVVTKLQRKLTR